MKKTEEIKVCSKCLDSKELKGNFYAAQGRYRSECKACTIKRNVNYQKKNKPWKRRCVDKDSARSYMVEYYAKNKAKFAEYRRKFRERFPDYHREYADKKRGIQDFTSARPSLEMTGITPRASGKIKD